jgi:hypothetical protein
MKFRFIGDEPSLFFEFQWVKGVVHDVTDPHAIGKLSNSVLFEKVDGDSFDEAAESKPRRGRPPKVRSEEVPADDDQNAD